MTLEKEINPGATEVCGDERDNNCNFYTDVDADEDGDSEGFEFFGSVLPGSGLGCNCSQGDCCPYNVYKKSSEGACGCGDKDNAYQDVDLDGDSNYAIPEAVMRDSFTRSRFIEEHPTCDDFCDLDGNHSSEDTDRDGVLDCFDLCPDVALPTDKFPLDQILLGNQ